MPTVCVMEGLTPPFEGLTVSEEELAKGYSYRVTRYADVILRDAFPGIGVSCSLPLQGLPLTSRPTSYAQAETGAR